MIRKTLSYLLLFAAVGAVGWFVFKRGEALLAASAEREPEIRSITVETGSIQETIEIAGFVEPLLSTEVKSEISGRILRVLADDGDTVEEGDVLAELDPTSLRTDRTEAQRNYQAQVLRVEQEKGFRDAKTELDIAEIELEVRQARLEKAEENLSKTEIRAPHRGVISNRGINVGQVIVGATSVNQGTTLMRVNDLGELVINIDINEVDIARINETQSPEIRIDAYPGESFDGRIAEIARFAVNRNNIRVFPVEIRFSAKDFTVSPGVSATVRILVAEVSNVPVLPISSIFVEGGQKIVFRRKPDSEEWERVPVETGLSDFDRVEIVSGIRAGDEVAGSRPEGFPRGAQRPRPPRAS